MPLIHEEKLIFYHVPKTAGTAVCHHFDIGTSGHQHANHYYSLLGDEFYSWKQFTIIRHPLLRFASAKNMYLHPPSSTLENNEQFAKNVEMLAPIISLPLDEFFYESQKIPGEDLPVHFWPLACFFYTKLDKRVFLPSHVLRYENLDQDWESLQKVLGLPIKSLPKTNMSSAPIDLEEELSESFLNDFCREFYLDFKIIELFDKNNLFVHQKFKQE